jgi:hypothetical protein
MSALAICRHLRKWNCNFPFADDPVLWVMNPKGGKWWEPSAAVFRMLYPPLPDEKETIFGLCLRKAFGFPRQHYIGSILFASGDA